MDSKLFIRTLARGLIQSSEILELDIKDTMEVNDDGSFDDYIKRMQGWLKDNQKALKILHKLEY